MDEKPCGWVPAFTECEGGASAFLDSLTDQDREAVTDMAVEFLWRWTGKQFGVCEWVVRPCLSRCGGQRPGTYWGRGPFPGGDTYAFPLEYVCGQCLGRAECDCLGGDAFRLPGPVVAVSEIIEDGSVLPSSAYTVSGNAVVRQDGRNWYRCQDVEDAPDAPGTWQVTYSRGIEVPVGGQIAAGLLADQFARALCGASDCSLPQRVQTVTRQGVTVGVLDSFEDVTEGRTGIWLIDSWIASVMAPRARSSVITPERFAQRPPRARI